MLRSILAQTGSLGSNLVGRSLLTRLGLLAITTILLSTISWSPVHGQVVIRERVEVQTPESQSLRAENALASATTAVSLADCAVARGAVTPTLDRYIDAVGGPNRIFVSRPGVLRILPYGGFAEFVRPNGPLSDPPVLKTIEGVVTITNENGDTIWQFDLASFNRTSASNRSYQCQYGGPIYHVTRNSYGESARIDVPVAAGIYFVSFQCTSCSTAGSSAPSAFFTTSTVTDGDGREHEVLVMRQKCNASAGLSYCFCHTSETDMALMQTSIRFSFDPYLPDYSTLYTNATGPVVAGDSARVFLDAYDIRENPALGQDTVAVVYPDSEPIDFVAIPDTLGAFSVNGVRSSALDNVPYQEVAAGNVWYVAGTGTVGALAAPAQTSGSIARIVSLTASGCGSAASFDLDIEEAADVIAMELTMLKKSIWPYIPRRGASSRFDFSQVDDSVDISVSLTRNGDPVAEKGVMLMARFVPGSGGHQHTKSNSKTPPEDRNGTFRSVQTGTGTYSAPAPRGSAKTDQFGIASFRYGRFLYGGRVVITADAIVDQSPVQAVDTLEVRVPGLEALNAPPSDTLYQRIGGTCNHPGPRDDNLYEDCREPDSNHYGTPGLNAFIAALADTFTVVFEEGALRVNDMSLPRGGMFDIQGKWKPSHHFHRVGRDVDLRTRKEDQPRQGIPVGNVEGENRRGNLDFENLASGLGAFPDPRVHFANTKDEHYHVFFYPNPNDPVPDE